LLVSFAFIFGAIGTLNHQISPARKQVILSQTRIDILARLAACPLSFPAYQLFFLFLFDAVNERLKGSMDDLILAWKGERVNSYP
jgi:hypothetical protein